MGDMDDVLLAIQALSLGGSGAVRGVRERQSTQKMLQQAHSALSGMGLPEASRIADMLASDPAAANKYVLSMYGSWPEMMTHLRGQADEEAAAAATRKAGGEDVPEFVRQRREWTAGMLQAGQRPDAASMAALFPGPITPQALGIDPAQWDVNTVQEVMDNYRATGVADLTPLRPKAEGGGIPDEIKVPTGWWFNPRDGSVKPIPGTNAETDYYLNLIMRRMREAGLGFDEYFQKFPQDKAFFLSAMGRIANESPMMQFWLDMLQRGGEGGLPQKPPGPTAPPSPRSNLR